MTNNVLRIFILIITFLILSLSIKSQTLIDLKKPLNKETYQKWEAYIKQFAPADSAFRVVLNIAQRHYFADRAAVSAQVFKHFKPYFPNRDSIIDEQIKAYEEVMISTTPTRDLFDIYQQFINENAPSERAFVALQRIADNYIDKKDWDSAATVFNAFKPLFPNKAEYIYDIMKIIISPHRNIKITNLGDSINTGGNEWDPTPTPDGKTLYFSASPRRGGKGGSDIWYSKLNNGMWGKSLNLGKPINAKQEETIDNVSADGTTVLLSGTFPGTYGKFDIYYGEKTSDSWSNIQHYPMPINSKHTDEGGNLTADGNAILFSSDRRGGIGEFKPFMSLFHGNRMGNMDIYVSEKDNNGKWGEPINLGEIINTPYSERAPFLHPDGKTLYFSSDGHPGLGRLDIFKTTRLNDTSWTEWSKPINIGKEINSSGDDWGYVVSLSGDSAFFAGYERPDTYGGWDIYSVSVPENIKPEELITIKGYIRNKDGYHLSAQIIWEDLQTGKKIGQLKSDPQTGFYMINLRKGTNYGYFANKRGFYPISNNIDLRNYSGEKEINLDITLLSKKELQAGETITINNIFFDYDKYELKRESIPELQRLVKFLKQNNYNIIIEGHTDNIGTPEHNKTLSKRRAESVANYLNNNGISKNRIQTKGFGSSIPLKANTSFENRAKNRRVEIRFIEK